jgi:hypothetical protein
MKDAYSKWKKTYDADKAHDCGKVVNAKCKNTYADWAGKKSEKTS